jgi:hypothetical protein
MRKFLYLCGLVLVAAPVGVAAKTPSADDKERQICKRIPTTGSLARVERLCGTKEFWDSKRREARRLTERVQEGGRAVPIAGPGQ